MRMCSEESAVDMAGCRLHDGSAWRLLANFLCVRSGSSLRKPTLYPPLSRPGCCSSLPFSTLLSYKGIVLDFFVRLFPLWLSLSPVLGISRRHGTEGIGDGARLRLDSGSDAHWILPIVHGVRGVDAADDHLLPEVLP
jgi:hypothetical protein